MAHDAHKRSCDACSLRQRHMKQQTGTRGELLRRWGGVLVRRRAGETTTRSNHRQLLQRGGWGGSGWGGFTQPLHSQVTQSRCGGEGHHKIGAGSGFGCLAEGGRRRRRRVGRGRRRRLCRAQGAGGKKDEGECRGGRDPQPICGVGLWMGREGTGGEGRAVRASAHTMWSPKTGATRGAPELGERDGEERWEGEAAAKKSRGEVGDGVKQCCRRRSECGVQRSSATHSNNISAHTSNVKNQSPSVREWRKCLAEAGVRSSQRPPARAQQAAQEAHLPAAPAPTPPARDPSGRWSRHRPSQKNHQTQRT